jgi:regulator of RNase E activity RraA
MNADDVRGLNASLVADAMQRLRGAAFAQAGEVAGLTALTGLAAVGPAYTVRVGPALERRGDERRRWFDAIDRAPAGAIFVIQADPALTAAVFGEMVALRLHALGLRGAVVDGFSRDLQPIRDLRLPYWTRGITMRGTIPDELDTTPGIPVTIGAVTIRPGDLIAADADGVIVCPAEDHGEVLEVSRAFRDSEVITQQRVRGGDRLYDCYPSKSSISLQSPTSGS